MNDDRMEMDWDSFDFDELLDGDRPMGVTASLLPSTSGPTQPFFFAGSSPRSSSILTHGLGPFASEILDSYAPSQLYRDDEDDEGTDDFAAAVEPAAIRLAAPPAPAVHALPHPTLQSSDATASDEVSDDASCPKTAVRLAKANVIYRNVFSPLVLEFPPAFASRFEGKRVYVHPAAAYPGKARRYKALPDAGEDALVVRVELTTEGGAPVTEPCSACDQYFDEVGVYKANPKLRHQMILARCSRAIFVLGGAATLHFKVMCAPCHLGDGDCFNFRVTISNGAGVDLAVSEFPLITKAWKKGGVRVTDKVADSWVMC